ncbi:MAG: prepilin-type N-terminal cleavage/methylation domain-containing protein [Syntrophobacteraceae bacterium]|jgi:MSHA pilin protein MshA|nr:prepilin-type N-terminal cleavage/methylation domain-containing protein [Syntrophobacteraceae bacterium]
MPSRKILGNQGGFTLVEIIAVLVILGILGAVAVPKYMDLTNDARAKAAQGQISELKGRLSVALAGHMLEKSGAVPASGKALVDWLEAKKTGSCPASAETDDFKYGCTGDAATRKVTLTVTEVQKQPLTTAVTATYDFSDAG